MTQSLIHTLAVLGVLSSCQISMAATSTTEGYKAVYQTESGRYQNDQGRSAGSQARDLGRYPLDNLNPYTADHWSPDGSGR